MRERERDLGTAELAGAGVSLDEETTSESRYAPEGEEVRVERTRGGGDEEAAPLFAGDEARGFRARWEEIQTAFVDEPRGAVQRADNLVAETMKRLAEVFAAERAGLEEQWSSGSDVSTEDLRLALRRYRAFFDRLLSV